MCAFSFKAVRTCTQEPMPMPMPRCPDAQMPRCPSCQCPRAHLASRHGTKAYLGTTEHGYDE
eukprot:4591522-Prymnesium_polylepis.1